jgi:photosystem II stability/assembly factor-like uncharacterized protein
VKSKSLIPIFMMFFLTALLGCSPPETQILATSAPTIIPPTMTVRPSDTPLPPTETATPLPPTPTLPPANPIQHYPNGQEFTVTSIHMIDANLGWGIGGLIDPGEHVLRTVDGGTTWIDVTPPEQDAPEGDRRTATGFFQDAQTAWVIFSYTSGVTPAQSVVWRTQDGGASWQASQPLDLTNLTEFYNPSNLQFVGGQTGWLMAHVGVGMMHDYIVLYRSQDGGVSWSRIQDPYNDTSLIMSCSKTGLQFTDATHGWLTGDCHGVAAGVQLFNSLDGGVSWTPVTLPDPAGVPGLFSDMLAACGSYDPYFFSNDLGHIGVNCVNYTQDPPTYQYYLFTTLDGGSTWVSGTYPGKSLYFYSADTGWAAAEKIQRTLDGGLTWKAMSNVSWSAQLDFVSEQLGWAVARNLEQIALVKTTDGGAKWAILVPKVGP